MATKLIIIPLILILLSCSVYSAYDWQNEANAGRSGDDYESRMVGYGLNMRNNYPVINTSYAKCVLAGSLFTPIALDSIGETYAHIITGLGSTLTIYDRTCAVVQTIAMPEALRSMPQIVNWNEDNKLEIIVPVAKGVLQYQWSDISDSYLLIGNISNSSISNIDYISCPVIEKYCLGFNLVSSETYMINYTTQLIHKVATHTTTNGAYQMGGTTGVSNIESPVYIPYCFIGQLTGHTYFECAVYNNAGVILYTPSFGSITYSPYRQMYISAFYAWLGTTTRLFFSGRGYDSPSGNAKYMFEAAISDGVATTLFSDINVQAADPTRTISGWSVADFNKDGYNEACYMHIEGVTPYLKCLDATLTTIIDVNVSGVMSFNNIVLADFVTNSTYISIGTYEGIFIYNDTSHNIEKWFSTGLTGTMDGFPIVYKDGSGNTAPLMLYSDTSVSFVLKLMALGVNCGNGICESSENQFTCLMDCNTTNIPINSGVAGYLIVGDWCNTASDCLSGECEYHRCALKVGGKPCVAASECLSGSCVNSHCGQTDIFTNLETSKNQMFGNSINANNAVSLFLILGGAFGLGIMTMGVILPILWVVITTIAFTIFGWLSPFILVGLFLIGLIIVVLGVVIGGSKS